MDPNAERYAGEYREAFERSKRRAQERSDEIDDDISFSENALAVVRPVKRVNEIAATAVGFTY